MVKRLPLAQRVAAVAPFHVMELLARARTLEAAGRSIVHMEIGEPDFRTAQPICDAGTRAIEAGRHFYTPALGIPELRTAIARFYGERYGVEVPASRIIITSGSSGALLLAIGALIDPGDEVLMTDPGYPCNRNFVRGQTVGVNAGNSGPILLAGAENVLCSGLQEVTRVDRIHAPYGHRFEVLIHCHRDCVHRYRE